MHGRELHIPTLEDLGEVFQRYVEDARERSQRGALQEGEEFTVLPDGRVEVAGHAAVMLINERLVRLLQQKNGSRQVYYEESFPLENLYSHAAPTGLILKLSGSPLERLPPASIENDRVYWTELVRSLAGEFDVAAGMKGLCARTERLFVRGETASFGGDPDYFKGKVAPEHFARCRKAIAAVYEFRAQRSLEEPERARMTEEADLAYRQAVFLAPFSPQIVIQYAAFLMQERRTREAALLVQTTLKLEGSRWMNGADPSISPGLTKLRGLAEKLSEE
jgi:hypothetical protein